MEVSSCLRHGVQRFCRAQAGVDGPKHPEGAAFIKQNPDAEQLMYDPVLLLQPEAGAAGLLSQPD